MTQVKGHRSNRPPKVLTIIGRMEVHGNDIDFMVVLYLTFLLVMTLGLLSVVSKTRNPNFYNSLYPWTLPTYYLNSNFPLQYLKTPLIF